MATQLPFEPAGLLQAPPGLRALQADGDVHEVRTVTGDDAYLVTGYDTVRRLLDDDRFGRSHPDPEHAARTGESVLFGGPLGNFETERADHARMRALLRPHFTPARMRAFRPRLEALTAELLDDLAGASRPADLHAGLALPLPILVICELLGVPYEDREEFRGWTTAAGDTVDRRRSEQGLGSLFEYGLRLVSRKRAEPGDDVISRLCAVDGLGDDEIAMLSMSLLFAGHETTVVQLGYGALLLLTHAESWRALRDDPGLIRGAVEEVLRASGTGGNGIPRYTRVDVDIDGTTVRAGDLVLFDTGAANHDARAFAEPDRFEVRRDAAGQHLTFGHGARYCLGAPLARVELEVALGRLVQRFPAMRLAVPVEELTVRRGVLTGGLTALPVTW
ncbi:MAG TPA: cytochrome P450 [Streptosporangiales bacterium]